MTEILTVKLTGIAHGGEALGKLGNRILFVAYALPGETVRVALVEEHKRWVRGKLVEIVEPSPHRIAAPCPHFGPDRCGGCQWQHIARTAQLDYKRRIVREQLQRLGGVGKPLVRPTVDPGPEWAYRTQMLFYPSGSGSLGQRRFQGYEVEPIDHCPLQHPALAELYADFNVEWDGLRSVDFSVGLGSGQRLIALRTQGDEAPELEVDVPVAIALEKRNGAILPLIGEPSIFETIAGQTYRFSAGARRPFNPLASEALLNVVEGYLQPRPGRTLMDVYCGAGLFSLGFAAKSSLVIGVDDDAAAIEDCAFNCQHLDNVLLHEGEPPRVLRLLRDPIDLAVVTPPAKGMGHRIAQNLARMGAKRAVSVAQNPAVLARDIDRWRRAGFRFLEATPIDVAPQTYFVTTVALFGR
jgi:tRNA/tmRNA/rRNA uracil-C5-methylase (TrmA/RlmC/RlmD family)